VTFSGSTLFCCLDDDYCYDHDYYYYYYYYRDYYYYYRYYYRHRDCCRYCGDKHNKYRKELWGVGEEDGS
jgi:hypothetical protein